MVWARRRHGGHRSRIEGHAQGIQAQSCASLALALVETCVRNSRLEELHTGISPDSAVGDYSDVKVVTPYGDIPWARR